jgi:Mrp family chromosome partitioning ATPase
VVLKANATEKEVFERAESLLKSVNANILGVVLNALKAERGFSSSPYYHAYYAYYGGKERKRKKRMLGY